MILECIVPGLGSESTLDRTRKETNVETIYTLDNILMTIQLSPMAKYKIQNNYTTGTSV